MAKKSPPKVKDNEEIHIKVENWQWETTSRRFTWKHVLVLAFIITVLILFSFGFLIISGIVLISVIIINIILFIYKKLA